jgi:hypothetical protein
MSSIYLKVEPVLGHGIKNVAEDMVITANRLGINVETEFNQIMVLAIPGKSVKEVLDQYHLDSRSRRMESFYQCLKNLNYPLQSQSRRLP